MTAVLQIKDCLANGHHFVLQGGAGSGKTETLKEILLHISATQPGKNVACITLTNKAADEVKNRLKSDFHVSTIHSFLHSLIGPYHKEIKTVIHEIFIVKPLLSPTGRDEDIEHKIFKDKYKKFATVQYRFNRIKAAKVVGKREYDKDVKKYVSEFREIKSKLNEDISVAILLADCYQMKYNETPFDNIRSFSYGHDGLLKISAALLTKYPTLQRILSDRFDFVFVDEYQDTSPNIVRVLLDVVAKNSRSTIGFFGDSMQGIYKEGVGDVDADIARGTLQKIEKEDNFRCSVQVVNFLNTLRLDTLTQEVAFKAKPDGKKEELQDRQGKVICFYAIAPEGARDNKEQYVSKLKSLIAKANPENHAKILMLTNKSIAKEVGFPHLFGAFNDRYGQDCGEQMKRILGVLQLDGLTRLCSLFARKEFNEIISLVKQGGFTLNSQEDKVKLHARLSAIVSSKDSTITTLTRSYDFGLLKQSDTCVNFIEYKDEFLREMEVDEVFQTFLKDMNNGANTAIKMAAAGRDMDEFLFEELKRQLRKRNFYQVIFGDTISFSEVINYFEYLNDEKPYVTMHKTKGTGIENVVVVLDEYFWDEYNFKNIFAPGLGADQFKDRKLVYVACSRAVKNLSCVRLISEDEFAGLKLAGFDSVIKFEFEDL